jgi:cob(I)alamin adenosyltransferase
LKIYTRTGDDGTTGLVGGSRISKTDARMEAIGTVDELNAVLGHAVAVAPEGDLHEILKATQSLLFELGAELATPVGSKFNNATLGWEPIDRLEGSMDELTNELEPLRHFVLPGGSEFAARLHVARAVCRRAERAVLATESPRPLVCMYLNRLSDWLFVAARTANARSNVEDVKWISH